MDPPEEVRTDEDIIIETLIIENEHRMYEDIDFLPVRSSLYTIESIPAGYDQDVCEFVTWCRPHELSPKCCYFAPDYISPHCVQGTLPDDVFMGALMAVCLYPGYDLLQNIIASRPGDFARHGVYSCRFYVEGQWVDVTTDTKLPCIRDQLTGLFSPIYSRSKSQSEMWISLIEKAYAKALGSYEAICKVKIHEALMHLTGGSVQQIFLHDEATGESKVDGSWKLFKSNLHQNTMILAQPSQFAVEGGRNRGAGGTETPGATMGDADDEFEEKKEVQGFLANKLYSVVSCQDIGGFELVLMYNPWSENCWGGEWSEGSSDWDTYPEILTHIKEDKSILWSLERPNGYFWMTFKNFNKYFNSIYFCKLFPSKSFSYYCVRGEWKDHSAGGPMNTIRNIEEVAKEAEASRVHALQKATAAAIVDGDVMWFNNPQYNISCNKETTVYISVIPTGQVESETSPIVSINVISTAKSILEPHLFDAATARVVSTEYIDGIGRQRGQEVSIWALKLDPRCCYHIVPNTHRRSIWSSFVMRIFAKDHPLLVQALPPLFMKSASGEWRRAGDLDTTGGAPVIVLENGTKKVNSKWCQNPQYHIELADPFGRNELHMKITLKRSDKASGGAAGGKAAAQGALGGEKQESTVGMVVCKATVLEDKSVIAAKRAKPRENALGELIKNKESSLKPSRRAANRSLDEMDMELRASHSAHSNDGHGHGTASQKPAEGKVVLRKSEVPSASSGMYSLSTTFSHKNDATIYYPKVPRAWMPDGLIVTPCLSDKGVRGQFDLEVFCSEPIKLTLLPDAFSRAIAGEWTEATAGGSHICHATWKKNAKYSLRLRGKTIASTKVTITVARHGEAWKSLCRADTVGCMIGFCLFIHRPNMLNPGGVGELSLYHESPYVPSYEVTTDSDFTLPPLESDEEYCIMPTTMADGKHGAFVLSVIAECEFILSHLKQ